MASEDEDRYPIHPQKPKARKPLGQQLAVEIPRLENPRKIGLDHSVAHGHEKLAFSFSAWYHAEDEITGCSAVGSALALGA